MSGIASLFQPAPKLPEDPPYLDPTASQSTLAQGTGTSVDDLHTVSSSQSLPHPPQRPDPLFNAPFFNDKPFEERPFIQRVIPFIAKHRAEGVGSGLAKLIDDHLEFGGCLADYPGLHKRYRRIRALEDVDEVKAMSEGHPAGAYAQVRFVNYYTMSSGVPKKPKTPAAGSNPAGLTQTDSFSTVGFGSVRTSQSGPAGSQERLPEHLEASTHTGSLTPRSSASATRITIEDYSDENRSWPSLDSVDKGKRALKPNNESEYEYSAEKPEHLDISRLSMQNVEPVPMAEPEETAAPIATVSTPDGSNDELNLPPLPEDPTPPVLPDLDQCTDKDMRKQAEKEAKRLTKAYEQALKDRARGIKEREKLIQKRRKEAHKKQDREAQKDKQKLEKEQQRLEKEKRKLEKAAAQRLEKLAEQAPVPLTQSEGEELRLEKERQRMEIEAYRLRGEEPPAPTPEPYSTLEKGPTFEQLAATPASETPASDMAFSAPATAPEAPPGTHEIPALAHELPGASPAAAHELPAEPQPPAEKKQKQKQRRKKFCTLPGKHHGRPDEAWVDVYMDGMSEVTAHCGLFFHGPHYSRLVGDVGSRIVGWVQDDLTKRTILTMPVD